MSAVADVVPTELEDWRLLEDHVSPTVAHDLQASNSVEFSGEVEGPFSPPIEFLRVWKQGINYLPDSEEFTGELDVAGELVTPTIKFELHFRNLVEAWKRDTSHLSLVSLRVSHPAYKEIISMGRQVLPLILAELVEEPDHWFHALSILADENPVSTDFSGTVGDAAALWIAWGRNKKFIPDAA